MIATRACAALAALASVVVPLLVRADPPPSQGAAGFVLPTRTTVALVLQNPLGSATSTPGETAYARIAAPLTLQGRTLAPRGSEVVLTVTAIRHASPAVDGAIFLSVSALRLTTGADLPLSLSHPVISPLLVAANPQDIRIPGAAPSQPPLGSEIVLPSGTVLRATTEAAVDATDPQRTVIVTPPPYTLSTDRPYSAFTPIPLFTYNTRFYTPAPRRGSRGRARPSASPSPTPTSTSTSTSETATPTPS
ncbi:MAG: hypothetical protein JO101_12805, partial [Candidatus Eremiobacteraeota bacterium]|nr:hypothetical protein [Candidatus Eremiobacteraeota bacterium]